MSTTTSTQSTPMSLDDARTEVRACLDAYERAMERANPDWTKHIGMTVDDAAGQERWVLEAVRSMAFGKVGAVFVDILAENDADALMHYGYDGEQLLRRAFTAQYPWLATDRLVILGGGCILFTGVHEREGDATAKALNRKA